MFDFQMNQDVPVMSISTDFQEHNWKQYGNELVCEGGCRLIVGSRVSTHGTRIKTGLMLSGSKGSWKLIVEGPTPRSG